MAVIGDDKFDELFALLELLESQIEHIGNRMDYVISMSRIKSHADSPPPARVADRRAKILMALGE